mmetsp:Transcript_4916/g.14442  ORF Transcript_4916/g.14442 Transcript_4916/m.14442 type:complete len:296 (+) Transcript_4916:916-1803(+)
MATSSASDVFADIVFTATTRSPDGVASLAFRTTPKAPRPSTPIIWKRCPPISSSESCRDAREVRTSAAGGLTPPLREITADAASSAGSQPSSSAVSLPGAPAFASWSAGSRRSAAGAACGSASCGAGADCSSACWRRARSAFFSAGGGDLDWSAASSAERSSAPILTQSSRTLMRDHDSDLVSDTASDLPCGDLPDLFALVGLHPGLDLSFACALPDGEVLGVCRTCGREARLGLRGGVEGLAGRLDEHGGPGGCIVAGWTTSPWAGSSNLAASDRAWYIRPCRYTRKCTWLDWL